MIYLTAFLIICLIIQTWIIYNLYSQNIAMESIIQNNSVEDEALKVYDYLLKLFIQCQRELEQIDKRGAFSSDDEVGFTFVLIRRAIDTVIDKMRLIRNEG